MEDHLHSAKHRVRTAQHPFQPLFLPVQGVNLALDVSSFQAQAAFATGMVPAGCFLVSDKANLQIVAGFGYAGFHIHFSLAVSMASANS